MHKKALYAGSFDPFTNGHLDIVQRALSIFDELVIVIAVSANKSSLLSKDKKKELISEIFCDDKRVSVDAWDGLLVEYAKNNQISSIVRGLRPTGDFEFEFQMASMNRKLNSQLETVFFTTGENLYYISSSLVKEVFKYGGDISKFVPKVIADEMLKRRV